MNTAFLLLMLTLAHGTEPSSPEAGVARDAAWAETRDQLLPSLESRAKAARIAEQARQSFFAGTSSTAEAWGTLALRDLDRRDAITARMAALDRAMVARAMERQAPIPDLGSERRQQRVVRAREDALLAEERNEQLERRWLAGRLGFLEAHPIWAAESPELAAPLEEAWNAAI